MLDAGSWHSSEFAGEPIPCLSEIAEFCRQQQLLLNIEIKPSPGEEERCGHLIAQAVAHEWAGQGGAFAWPLLSSFKPESLLASKLAAPHLQRALLLEEVQPDSLDIANSLECVAVVLEQSQWSPTLVRAVSSRAIAPMTYTVNEASRARELALMGVVGLITDALPPF
jgi:glycerophosphoryl diester phosphodiesterase